MTKHIDLLRAHQKKKKQARAVHADTSTNASLNNPYRSPATSQYIPGEPLAEEEPVSFSPAGAVQQYPDSEFNISTWLLEIAQKMLHIFEAAEKREPADISTLQNHLSKLMPQMEKDRHTLDKLELEVSRNIQEICHLDIGLNDLVQKSIMMMLYTIKVGYQLKIEHHDILQHTLAAMLHHIGMATVPDEIRKKVDKLEPEELQLIKEAPARAAEYLSSCNIDHSSILTAVMQASERYDGSGATGLSGRQITWTARIIGLLSMFEALIHFRPYRQRLLPRDAIRELVNHHKKAFDPMLLKALIESISLYPVGTFVQLNTGEIGQVITIHNKFPLRPIVHINMDRYGNVIAKREVDLKQQPNLMIKKCMYEESLVEQD